MRRKKWRRRSEAGLLAGVLILSGLDPVVAAAEPEASEVAALDFSEMNLFTTLTDKNEETGR